MKEITLLGNQNTKYEYDYNPKILDKPLSNNWSTRFCNYLHIIRT